MKTENYKRLENISVPIIYPPGSGGNFFMTCLSLSDSVVIHGYPNIERKCDYICSFYDSMDSKHWSDINIYYKISPKKTDYIFCHMHPEVWAYYEKLSHPNYIDTKKLSDFGVNSNKIILFKNSFLFSILREPKILKSIPKNIDVDTYIKMSNLLLKYKIDLITYHNLDSKIKHNLRLVCDNIKLNMSKNYSYCLIKSKKQIYFWDVNWNLNEEDFLYNLKNFYIGFNLRGFNEEVLKKCYRSWMDSMYRYLNSSYNLSDIYSNK